MNKFIYVFLFLASVAHSQIIELPYTFHNGWGEYEGRSFGGISFGHHPPESRWGKMAIETTGLPEGFSPQRQETDIIQFVWQSYTTGKIDKESFLGFMESWNIDTLSENFTRDYIRCYVHVAIKKENDSTFLYMVDTNNDLDFSDEEIHKAAVIDYKNMDELYRSNVISFTYDAYAGDKLETQEGEILIFEGSEADKSHRMYYLFTFPHNCKANLEYNGEEYDLLFQFSGGLRLQSESSVSVEHPVDKTSFSKDQSIIIGNYGFRIKGANPSKKVLLLEKYRLDPNAPLAQKGFFAPEIAGVEFNSGDSLKLSDYRGKHVLLYVWGTWCKPCYGSLPKLAALNDSISEEELQIFSAQFNSNPEALSSIIEEHNIHWPQLLNTQCATNLQADYVKRGVPFSCLISPDGKIVEVNVHVGDDLVGRIRGLMAGED